MSKSIALIDSGIGGITILTQAKKLMPSEDFIYFADNANMPYGSKSTQDLQNIAINLIKKISSLCDIKLFVLACNTLTAAAIDILRDRFPQYMFVGTEPNVVQATKENEGKTLVLVTPSCLNCPRVFFRLYCDKTIFLTVPKLAEAIEDDLPDYEIENLIKNQTQTIKTTFSSVVLGCTHYSIKKDLIKSIFNLPVYDSVEGVTNRTKNVLVNNNMEETNELPVLSLFFSKTDPQKAFQYRNFMTNLKKNEKIH